MNHDLITDQEFKEGCDFLGKIAVIAFMFIVGGFIMWVKL